LRFDWFSLLINDHTTDSIPCEVSAGSSTTGAVSVGREVLSLIEEELDELQPARNRKTKNRMLKGS
jgi:hypothetical protein